MTLPIYQIDAFTQQVFGGNPAAVVPLQAWLDDEAMLAIAAENNLAETAFFVPSSGESDYELRWFTPGNEIDLCGHATLATAFTLFEHLNFDRPQVSFATQSGELVVSRDGDRLTMDFPSRPAAATPLTDGILEALGLTAIVFSGLSRDWLIEVDDEDTVAQLKPDFSALAKATDKAVIVTARGQQQDFVSRFFAPHFAVPEDPVTGSAHCTLVPYWADQLDKTLLEARQISARGGDLYCELAGDRVFISGYARSYLVGYLSV
ncbi:MAG: isomerase [Cellvibrionaceae bacterium]|nr:isomerase [Cellvibrionaceae bacterium]